MKKLGIGSRISHPIYGKGVIVKVHPKTYEIAFISEGIMPIGKNFTDLEIIEATEPSEYDRFDEAEQALIKILSHYNGLQEEVKIGHKWEGGKLILKPGQEELMEKEIPLETFFHKIVMIRDRLRVMEQKINSSKLQESDKVTLQQYISRIYGSLTSFNILFKEKEDHFKS